MPFYTDRRGRKRYIPTKSGIYSHQMNTKNEDVIYHSTVQQTDYSFTRLDKKRTQNDGIAQFKIQKTNNIGKQITAPSSTSRLKRILDKLKPDTIEATLQLNFLPMPSVGIDVKAAWDFRKRKLEDMLTPEQKIQLFQKYENLLL